MEGVGLGAPARRLGAGVVVVAQQALGGEDTIVAQQHFERYWLVLKSFFRAALLYPISVFESEGYEFFFPDLIGQPEWFVIDSGSAFEVVPAKVVPTALHGGARKHSDGQPMFIVFLREAKNRSLLEQAAMHGVVDMPAVVIQQAMGKLRIPNAERPKMVLDQIILILAKLFPQMPLSKIAGVLNECILEADRVARAGWEVGLS